MELGFALSSEDHPPNELVRQAHIAERAGFTFGLISDHFHPWVSEQGHSPFVWSTLGGIAQATETIRIGTGVTCPLIRIHPAIVAQAAATVAAMMPGRFFLGVGTGENLNEHVTGARWPLAWENSPAASGTVSSPPLRVTSSSPPSRKQEVPASPRSG
jgi:coenzyme F420-dependent glucose-6-phosphate dehydrogenase